jgi:predicted Zn finger-like uncharacterized protein
MLKVECESCTAPYQIDERRVPADGLKMRCPKCGHSFVVARPEATARGASFAAPPAARPPAAPAPAAPARPLSPHPPRSPLPSDFPAALGSLDEPDLPVVSAELPVARGPTAHLPAAKKPPPPRPVSKGSAVPGPPPASPPVVPKPSFPPPQARPGPGQAATRSESGDGLAPDLEVALPDVVADLPEARRGLRKGPPPPRSRSLDIDLPIPAAPLPASKRDADLPSLAAALPATTAALPVIAAALPSPAASLPAVAANLPSPTAALPVVAAGLPSPAVILPTPAASLPTVVRGFGEIELPTAAETLPTAVPLDRHLPVALGQPPGEGAPSFGEIELPLEAPVTPPPPRPGAMAAAAPARGPSADFGDLELEDRPRSRVSASRLAASAPDATRDGGMTFGEVDFASGHDAAAGAQSISVVGPVPREDGGSPGFDRTADAASIAQSLGRAGDGSRGAARGLAGAEAAATAPVRMPARGMARDSEVASTEKRPIGKRVALVLVVVALLGGAALQLTSVGAYGYLYVVDRIHAKDYEQQTLSTLLATEKALGADTYDEAKGAVDAAAAAHARTPRAQPLAAYAAIVDAAATVRFGPDTSRASRVRQLLSDLPSDRPVKYVDVAQAAQAAANDELDKARKMLAAAGEYDRQDPIEVEVALLKGHVQLSAGDGAGALVEFQRALDVSNDARAHFGLARAYDLVGDAANARKEIDATLARSPGHAGALTLRARMKSAPTEEGQALKDLATVLEGPARPKAAPNELSRAYAARAWVSLERGSASEARDAFAQAVKIDPRNIAALTGEGRLFLSEGRYTEALARFETALQIEPGSPEAIADDAEAKLALERLADAKQQLVDARQRFPKNQAILVLLGQVEQHLGNNDAAEADLRAAVAMVEPFRREAVLPYVVLSELLSSRGMLSDAKTVLDDAKKKLAPSAVLDRALGDVAELQGEHDVAISHYQAAIAREPQDLASHFRLAVALRRIRKFDDAGRELDRVAGVDKNYPGLSLERGLLFEESGDVEKAIAAFKEALARAPDDPDLQLRVGSAYVAIGRPDDAAPMLRKVLQARPTSAEGHHYLGRALMLKGPSQQVEALRYLRRAVDLDPNRAEFHVYLAWAANEATPAQLELARDEIDKAMALDKLNAETYWQRGVLERMQGQIEDAIKDEKRALELRPSRYEAHATIAECYEDRNDDATATAEWAKAITGEGDATGPDGGVLHPYWRYRYGKLLMEHGNAGAALAYLLPSATTMEKSEQRPGWLARLEFLTAEALRKAGRRADAIEHYRRFLEIAPVTSPDRTDAQEQLKRLAP